LAFAAADPRDFATPLRIREKIISDCMSVASNEATVNAEPELSNPDGRCRTGRAISSALALFGVPEFARIWIIVGTLPIERVRKDIAVLLLPRGRIERLKEAHLVTRPFTPKYFASSYYL